MRNKIILAALVALAACAQPGRDAPLVKMGNEPADARTSAKAQDNRAAAAGGSHAPGATRYQ